MSKIESLVLEQLHALLKHQDDMHADLQEVRMCVHAIDEQLGDLDHLVSALATADSLSDGEIKCVERHLDLSEGQ